jgi:diazepam-binding inhibitor (GABA receptor modulating acyl-CoA-binding protein)
MEYNLEEKFNKYISKVKKLNDVKDVDKLILYGLYKQSLEGDNNKDKPSILDRIAMEKWKAWNNVKGLSKDESKKKYIQKVKDLYKLENKN